MQQLNVWMISPRLKFKEYTMTPQLRFLVSLTLRHPDARLDAAQQEAA